LDFVPAPTSTNPAQRSGHDIIGDFLGILLSFFGLVTIVFEMIGTASMYFVAEVIRKYEEMKEFGE